ncbi:MAG: DNA/RNA nuclease SfsA [Bacillota bacterium]
MTYDNIIKGTFISRPNRFVAEVIVNGKVETAHVKNTGRLGELLREGAAVYMQEHKEAARRTKWSLIGVEKDGRLVNIDSQAPNKVMLEWLQTGRFLKNIKKIKTEYSFGGSRFDFFVETDTDKVLIEVKGVTLETGNVAMFPDAPTERGVRHIFELCDSLKEGYRAFVVFVIKIAGVRYFTPNAATHQAFADALAYAHRQGVCILAVDCDVGENSLSIRDEVPVVLQQFHAS